MYTAFTGCNAGGYLSYIKDKKLHNVHNYLRIEEIRVSSAEDVPEGKVNLRHEFEVTGKPDIAA